MKPPTTTPPPWVQAALTLCDEALTCLSMAALFVSHRAASHAPRLPTQQEMRSALDRYFMWLDALRSCPDDPGNRKEFAAEAYARSLHALFETWEPCPDVPEEIMKASRALLETALDCPPPPGGWETFEQFPEQGW